jgi:hypothetical protein
MTGREVMEMVDTLDRCSAEIARLRALNMGLVAFVGKIAAMTFCNDPTESGRCHFDSGPYCDTHDLLPMDDEIKEARALLAKAGQC